MEIENKLRNLENVVGFFDVMSEMGEGTKTPPSLREVKSNVDIVNISLE